MSGVSGGQRLPAAVYQPASGSAVISPIAYRVIKADSRAPPSKIDVSELKGNRGLTGRSEQAFSWMAFLKRPGREGNRARHRQSSSTLIRLRLAASRSRPR